MARKPRERGSGQYNQVTRAPHLRNIEVNFAKRLESIAVSAPFTGGLPPALTLAIVRSVSTYKNRDSTRREPSFPGISAAQLGMYVGLGSLTMLFLASLVAYFITRAQSETWKTAELPHLPWGLWGSTVVLVLLSLTYRTAESSLRKNDYDGFRRGIGLSLALGLSFLALQVQNWRTMLEASEGLEAKNLYAFTFYLLTALHAVHVLAGIVPLTVIFSRARRPVFSEAAYSSSRSEGVRLTRQYWDFLLVVWFVLLGSLWFFS